MRRRSVEPLSPLSFDATHLEALSSGGRQADQGRAGKQLSSSQSGSFEEKIMRKMKHHGPERHARHDVHWEGERRGDARAGEEEPGLAND
jgi:hypothetical protein